MSFLSPSSKTMTSISDEAFSTNLLDPGALIIWVSSSIIDVFLVV